MTDRDPLAKLKAVSDLLVDVDPALFQQIIDSLPDSLLIADSAATILLVNQQLELMFGFPRSMVLGKKVEMFIPEDKREAHAKYFAGYFMAPSIRPMHRAQPLTGVHRDGRLIPIQINLSPIVSTHGTWALALIRRIVDAQ